METVEIAAGERSGLVLREGLNDVQTLMEVRDKRLRDKNQPPNWCENTTRKQLT